MPAGRYLFVPFARDEKSIGSDEKSDANYRIGKNINFQATGFSMPSVSVASMYPFATMNSREYSNQAKLSMPLKLLGELGRMFQQEKNRSDR